MLHAWNIFDDPFDFVKLYMMVMVMNIFAIVDEFGRRDGVGDTTYPKNKPGDGIDDGVVDDDVDGS